MIWDKHFGYDHQKHLDYILVAIFLAGLIGIFLRQPILYLLIGVFLVYLILNVWFDRQVGQGLTLYNEPMTIRLFPGEKGQLTLRFRNDSRLPMVNGELGLRMKRIIRTVGYRGEEDHYWRRINIPLSIIGKKQTVLKLPFVAEKRGVTRISHLDYTFPHLFNFQTVTLSYQPPYRTEILVYPELLPVSGIDVMFQMTPGVKRFIYSPFEDVQSMLGTRDYDYSDPFQRINWKASVKAGRLQTNVFEKVVDLSFLFLINLADVSREQLETLLSYTAYLAEAVTKQGLPFEVYINARKPGAIPFVHVPEGSGQQHYRYTLDMLARIESESLTVPYSDMVYRIGLQLMKPRTIIFLGNMDEQTSMMVDRWKQHHQLYLVKTNKHEAILKPWIQVNADANES